MRLTPLFVLLALVVQGCAWCPQPCCSPCAPVCCGGFVDVTRAEPAPPPKPKVFAIGGEKTTWEYLAAKYDKDRDGAVTLAEHGRGEAAFANIDADKDGKVTAADFKGPTRMQQFIAQMTVARYFQTDSNPMALSRSELEAAFTSFDTNEDDDLSEAEFAAARKKVDAATLFGPPPMPKGADPVGSMRATIDTDGSKSFSLAEMKAHFASRDDDGDGMWTMRPPRGGARPPRPQGPAVGTVAPDFTLSPPEGGAPVTLSSFKGKKAVALIFGSYT